jgi:hypothetical protein
MKIESHQLEVKRGIRKLSICMQPTDNDMPTDEVKLHE